MDRNYFLPRHQKAAANLRLSTADDVKMDNAGSIVPHLGQCLLQGNRVALEGDQEFCKAIAEGSVSRKGVAATSMEMQLWSIHGCRQRVHRCLVA
jgi:hypothetical protein